MRRLLLPLLLSLPFGAACGHAAGGASDAGDVPVIPLSCGTNGDCLSALLDADTCVYDISLKCAAIGQCRPLAMPTDTSKCTPALTVCPCSGDTQTVPACWQGYSPVAVQTMGACPADSGSIP